MVIIGLFLIVVAGAVGIDMIWKNNFPITDPTIFGQHLGIHHADAFFILGAIVGAAIMFGVVLLIGGLSRKSAKAVSRHRERKEADETREERDRLEAENSRLRRQAEEPQTEQKTEVRYIRPIHRDDDPLPPAPGATRADS